MCQLFISNMQKPHADRSWTCWSNRIRAMPAIGAIAPLLHSPSCTLHRFPFATLMNFPLLHQRESRAASSHTLLQADIRPPDTTAIRVLPLPPGALCTPGWERETTASQGSAPAAAAGAPMLLHTTTHSPGVRGCSPLPRPPPRGWYGPAAAASAPSCLPPLPATLPPSSPPRLPETSYPLYFVKNLEQSIWAE